MWNKTRTQTLQSITCFQLKSISKSITTFSTKTLISFKSIQITPKHALNVPERKIKPTLRLFIVLTKYEHQLQMTKKIFLNKSTLLNIYYKNKYVYFSNIHISIVPLPNFTSIQLSTTMQVDHIPHHLTIFVPIVIIMYSYLPKLIGL